MPRGGVSGSRVTGAVGDTWQLSSTTPVSLVDLGGCLGRFLHAGATLCYSQTQKLVPPKRWLLLSLSWVRKSSPPWEGGGMVAGAGSPMPAHWGLLWYHSQGCVGKPLCSQQEAWASSSHIPEEARPQYWARTARKWFRNSLQPEETVAWGTQRLAEFLWAFWRKCFVPRIVRMRQA